MIAARNDRKVVLIISNTGTDKLVSMILDTEWIDTRMIVMKKTY